MIDVPTILRGILVIGGLVLLRGLRGKRVGQEPRCRKCKYNLTGLTTERCPECGTPVGGKNTVFGVHRLHRWSVVVGGAMTLFSLGVLGTDFVAGVDWYRYYPAVVVVKKARNDDRQALLELVRRTVSRSLSESTVETLAELGVTQATAKPKPRNAEVWFRLSLLLSRQHALTTDQQKRLFEPLIQVDYDVRPRVWQHGYLGLEAECGNVPTLPYGYVVGVRPASLYINGQARPPAHERWGVYGDDQRWSPFRPATCMWWSAEGLQPGKYAAEFRYVKALFPRGTTPELGAPIWSAEASITAEVEVLGADAPEEITLPDNRDLAATLKEAIVPHEAHYGKADGSDAMTLQVSFRVSGDLPVDVSFEVIGVVNGREIALGSIAASTWRTDSIWSRLGIVPTPSGALLVGPPDRPDSARTVRTTTSTVQDLRATEVTLILRSSCQIGTPGSGSFPGRGRHGTCFDIWKGQLQYEPLTIERVEHLPREQRPIFE